MTTANKSDKDRVVIFDTTLRDGEQCPGATMSFEEKLEIAEMLDDMGVDVIEAGFPITSEGDFQAVSEIARRSKNAVIAGLARAHPKDIDRCAEAVKFAKRGRVHTVIATSPLHMKHKLQMAPEAVLAAVTDSVTHARRLVDDVEHHVGVESAVPLEDLRQGLAFDQLHHQVGAAERAVLAVIEDPSDPGMRE